ncbi:hypothetical protein AAY24_15055 [Sedimenticola thiotaurini]|uniref:Uncharacterized protein n=1 Tax=Sedimenticola thiotaurini TaxID=1543721 RepID=A0A0F7K1J9_9GAMM|nr:hypothetical protein AAY24_15055 [Sedimenticola thiotaurini]
MICGHLLITKCLPILSIAQQISTMTAALMISISSGIQLTTLLNGSTWLPIPSAWELTAISPIRRITQIF